MKNILISLIFVVLSFTTNAQKPNIDTSEMCLPFSVAQKILLDLNDYDRLKEIDKLNQKEIKELNNKIILLDKTIKTYVEKDSLSGQIISKTEEKVEIYKSENQRLADDNRRLKTKNTLFNIISGAIIAPLTYLLIIK
jgi:hypothetical protein